MDQWVKHAMDDDDYSPSSTHFQYSGRTLRYSPPASPVKPNVKRRPRSQVSQTDEFHVVHKVPVGDSPYVKAKHVQIVSKDSERAIALFWAAINAGDRVDSALKDMAILLMRQQNRSEEAIEAIKSLRSRCSDHVQEALDNILLDLFKRCGRLDDQITLLKHKLHLLYQGIAFHGKRKKTARSRGKKFQESLEQEVTRLLDNLGWAYMQQANYIAAGASYRKALSYEPDNNRICNLGICLIEQGRLQEAKVILQNVTPTCEDTHLCSETHMKSFKRAQRILVELKKCMQKGTNNVSYGTSVGREHTAPSQPLAVAQLQSVTHSEQESDIRDNNFRSSDALLATTSGFVPAISQESPTALIFTDSDRQTWDLHFPNYAENCSVRQSCHNLSYETFNSTVQYGTQDRSISVLQESEQFKEQSNTLTDSWRDIKVQGARSFVSAPGHCDEFLSHCKTPVIASFPPGADRLPAINYDNFSKVNASNMKQKREQLDQDNDQFHGINNGGSESAAILKHTTGSSIARFRSLRGNADGAASLWRNEMNKKKWPRINKRLDLLQDAESTDAMCNFVPNFPMKSAAPNRSVISDQRKQKDEYRRDAVISQNINEDLDFTCVNDVVRCVMPKLQSDSLEAAAQETGLPKTPASANYSFLRRSGEEVGQRRLQVFLRMTS